MTYADLLAHYGATTRAELARAMNKSRPTLIAWQRDGIPLDSQKLIEYETRGRLRADTRQQSRS